ncbi:putative glycoside hydrolase [Oceanicoccus sagamiensis]|uniref:Uncharacterized protein n=1 Tax=Oceanicoccus sagamiensis TaxID=716816 RepID=A0A1X9N8T8_9GAMM|nr:putative glycoside hydrolase [Oceanicoccus sagamiensis]ARN74086.1 hypothetical protein BST96_08100 [Oceanicoccus sagamiensis]
MIKILIIVMMLIGSNSSFADSDLFKDDFINNFQLLYGSTPKLTPSNIKQLSKNKLIGFDRFRYGQGVKQTWSEIRRNNKDAKIILYQGGPSINTKTDGHTEKYLNNVGRYKKSRGHSMGSVDDHPEWYLRWPLNVRAVFLYYPDQYILDFGNKDFQRYWLEATMTDVVKQKWVADGLMIDNCVVYHDNAWGKYVAKNIVNYKSGDEWNEAMNSFVNNLTQGLAENGQIVMANRGYSKLKKGGEAWEALDKLPSPPAVALDEGAFVVSWGRGDAAFLPEQHWLNQVELPEKINNSSVAYMAHIGSDIGEIGKDTTGSSFEFYDAFGFALGSYLLSKRADGPPTLFSFDYDKEKRGAMNRVSWFDVYETLDFGKATGRFYKVSEGKHHYYQRDFERGSVMVNPGNKVIRDIDIKAGYQERKMDATEPLSYIAKVNLKPQRAKFFQRVDLTAVK